MAVPSAQKTIAISIMKRNAIGTLARLCGRNPAIVQTIIISVPWSVATVAPPRVRPIMMWIRGTGATSVSFRKPNCRSNSRPTPEKIDDEEDRHADDPGRQKLEVAAVAGLLKRRAQAESQRRGVQRRLPERCRRSVPAIACSASAHATRGCTPHSSLNASTSSRTAASARRLPAFSSRMDEPVNAR